MKKHYNVVICTPGAVFYQNYMHALVETIAVLNEMGISWIFLNEFSPHIHQARDLILNGGANGNGGYTAFPDPNKEKVEPWKIFNGHFSYDQMIWIDNDVSWKIEDFLKILNYQEEVVTGYYVQGNNYATSVNLYFNTLLTRDSIKELNPNQLYPIYGCGMGFLKIRQGVIESLERPFFLVQHFYTHDKKTNMTYKVNNYEEDTSLCQRIKDSGRDIYFDPSIGCTHAKSQLLEPEYFN